MGIVLNWNSTYPGGGIDNTSINFPPVSDGIHDVLATHVNALASAVINLETAVGAQGGLGVREVDSSPNIRPVHTLVFPNGSLTNLGSNTVQVTVASGGGGDAEDIAYDNGTSGLSSTNVQDALDEIVALTPGGPGLNFTPVASDFGAPVVTGGSVTTVITDITGGSAPFTGLPRDFLSFEFEDPTSGTIVTIPLTLPSILPDRFKLNLGFFTGSTPPEDIIGGMLFSNAGATKNLGLVYQFAAIAAPFGPAISGGLVGAPTVSWALPADDYTTATDSSLLFNSIQPFSAVAPQLIMDYTVRSISAAPTVHNSDRLYGLAPSSGSMVTDLGGETLKQPSIYFVFPTGFVGTVNFAVWIDIQRHPEDNI